MKKTSKIWKIENINYPVYSGQSLYEDYGDGPVDNIQLIYESELDCVLDIVTEPENNGLKVYKHQIIVDTQIDRESGKEFFFIELNENDGDETRWFLEKKRLVYSKEDLDKLDVEYNFICQSITYYKQTRYYRVEVFMQ